MDISIFFFNLDRGRKENINETFDGFCDEQLQFWGLNKGLRTRLTVNILSPVTVKYFKSFRHLTTDRYPTTMKIFILNAK